jgi:bifunctional DNA-binding transcriptional regulator/antitoxin component of YhaV-PrlF toxin-antitoxin module
MDRDGRVAGATVIEAMGWRRGTRLDIRVSEGLVLVRADAQAVFRVTRSGHVRLPAPVRHWCGLTGGSRVLLVAYPETGLSVVQPPASLHAMVVGFHAAALGGDAG